MDDRFDACVAFTRREEGGYVADARDPGNWSGGRVGYGQLIGSNMGVGAATLQAWLGSGVPVSAELMRDLPYATYDAIARHEYWEPLGCGQLAAGLDLMVFDFGWNRGVAKSMTLLRDFGQQPGSPPDPDALCALLSALPQDQVGVVQKRLGVREDGVAGPVTCAALRSNGQLAPLIAVLAVCAAQIASYKRLQNFRIYGDGWLARTERRRIEALSVVP